MPSYEDPPIANGLGNGPEPQHAPFQLVFQVCPAIHPNMEGTPRLWR